MTDIIGIARAYIRFIWGVRREMLTVLLGSLIMTIAIGFGASVFNDSPPARAVIVLMVVAIGVPIVVALLLYQIDHGVSNP